MPPAAATRRRRGRARKAPAFHVSVFHCMPEPWEPWERDWAELPADALSCVLHKLSTVELLLGGVAEVCHSWCRAAREEPELWWHIDVRHLPDVPPFTPQATLENVVRVALRLSAGQCHTFLGEDFKDDLFLFLVKKAPSLKSLHISRCYHFSNGGFPNTIRKLPLLETFHGECINDDFFIFLAAQAPSLKSLHISRYYHFSDGGFPNTIRKLPLLETFHGECINDDFFMFLAAQAPSLKRLHLISGYHISNGAFANAIKKLPLLEVLELDNCLHVEEKLKLIAKVCRCLKHLTLVQKRYQYMKQRTDDRIAFTIARIHGLHSLKLVGDDLSNEGLIAILDNCPHLEFLQMRDCCNINMDYSLTAKCARIFMDYHVPPSSPCSSCSSPISCFGDSDYDPDDYHDLSLYSYLGDDIDGADFEEHERTLDVKSMRRYFS